MQKLEVGKFDNEILTFCQCESLEDAQKESMPDGVYSYWIYKGKKIYAPGEIVSMIVQHSQAGTFDVSNSVSATKVREYYNNLCEAQRTSTVEHLEQMKAMTVKQMSNVPKEVANAQLKNLDDTIKMYKTKAPMPDLDGIFRPTRAQAETMLHGKENVEKMLPPEMQDKVFVKE